MVYIVIDSSTKDEANQYVRDNIEHGATDTFTENFKGQCVISLPDNGTEYTEKMKEHFGFSEEMPEVEQI
jgi:hypothetical protein